MVSKLSFVLIIALGIFCTYLYTKTPVRHTNWVDNQMRNPHVLIEGNTATVTNLRDFRYNADGTTRTSQYLTKQYQINDLKQVWYGVSHFGPMGLAHVFLSFEFNQHEYLTASIEARMVPEQVYNPFKGLIKAYNRILVLGTEQDVIGLRTHYRNERVLLYPLQLQPEQSKDLLLNIFADANALFEAPDFYNTVLDNCITGVIQHSNQWSSYLNWLDYRIIFPGYSDRLAHQHQFIDSTFALDELQIKAQINPADTTPDSSHFSQEIRSRWRQ